MNWIRTNIQWGTRLALLALVLQFALSFGHFHGLDAPSAAISQAASATGSSSPDSDHPSDGAADLCAVCAVIAMAGTMLGASPPALPSRLPFAFRPFFAEVSLAEVPAPSSAFQPRGPPLS